MPTCPFLMIFSRATGVWARRSTGRPFQPYIVVLQHPVTTEYGDGFAQVSETLTAIAGPPPDSRTARNAGCLVMAKRRRGL